MKLAKELLFGLVLVISVVCMSPKSAMAETANTDQVNFWPQIPFIRGADLCRIKDHYSQTRTEYLNQMVGLATRLMYAGSSPREAWALLQKFNKAYEMNLSLGAKDNNLDVTLEATLKGFIDGYYRQLRPRHQNISFNKNNDWLRLVRENRAPTDGNGLSQVHFFAYGTYSLSPNCTGDVLVTVHLIGENGEEKTYLGQADPSVVMSRIAAKIFEDFQRTKFPSQVKVGTKVLTLVGGMNGSIDKAPSPLIARQSCETLSARLPDEFELEILNAYGSWSGGVSLGEEVWALPSGKVFAPTLRNPSPVREVWEVNATEFRYFCVLTNE